MAAQLLRHRFSKQALNPLLDIAGEENRTGRIADAQNAGGIVTCIGVLRRGMEVFKRDAVPLPMVARDTPLRPKLDPIRFTRLHLTNVDASCQLAQTPGMVFIAMTHDEAVDAMNAALCKEGRDDRGGGRKSGPERRPRIEDQRVATGLDNRTEALPDIQ